MKVQFDKYNATPGEKHLGVASVFIDDKFMFRYKVMPGKDGKGYYFKPASHKINEDTYIDAFLIDSNVLVEAIKECIKNGIRPYLSSVDEVPF